MAEKTIRIACKGSDAVPVATLREFQGNLKELSPENYEKLKKEILELGFSEPISVWKDKGKINVINGHQRLRVLSQMIEEGYKIPNIPVCEIEAISLKEAKLKVLALTSEYGTITESGLYEFLQSSNISFDEVNTSFNFPDIDLDQFKIEFYPGELTQEEVKELYSKKVEIPIYEPTMEIPPPIEDLVDTSKTKELHERIDKAKIPDDVKHFLRAAAERHNVFHYQRIAEFYAHAPKKVQELMEQSALVLIDFDKAIEMGFVALSEKVAEAYKNEEE